VPEIGANHTGSVNRPRLIRVRGILMIDGGRLMIAGVGEVRSGAFGKV
jgi:hypothetical protein